MVGYFVLALFGLSAIAAPGVQSQSLVQNPADAEYAIVALRVEFKPDSSRFSTGDGLFDGDLYGDAGLPSVDPLPHNAAYFDAHLAFLSNYVQRVSDGRTTLTTFVLPEVVQVTGPMGAYSPTGLQSESDEEVAKLASLVVEAWQLAALDPDITLPNGLDPARTAFVIFHAGVGRDIELLGNSLDKTPEDLPSLYFDSGALERLTGNGSIDFNGFPVSNTMVIPRTETRRGVNFLNDEAFLIELSINGLLAASFFNFLGVPDLFNTSSGESGIGPFGLMDGQGIFSYFGLMPPEPSAWTKIFLGWADIRYPNGSNDQLVALRYGGDPNQSDVFLAPVSDGEYFLAENRNRDPELDGVFLSVWNHDGIKEVHFPNGDPGFNSDDVSAFPGGVILSADNYDYVLPGGKDPEGNDLNGGILIWHIDESRILAGLQDNTVNADSSRRGVSLEEADGANDIGFPSTSFLGPDYSNGSPFDYFYEGNPFTVITSTGQEISLYENRFGPDTYPSSVPVAGGPGFIELKNFTLPDYEMEFVFGRVTSDGITERTQDFVANGFQDDIGWSFSGSGGIVREMPSPDIDFLAFATDVESPEGGGRKEGRLYISKDGSVLNQTFGLLSARPAVGPSEAYAISRSGFVVVRANGLIEMLYAFPPTVEVVEATTALVLAGDGGLYVGVETKNGSAFLSFVDGVFDAEMTDDRILSLGMADGIRPILVFRDHAEVRSTTWSWKFDSLSEDERFQAFFYRSGENSGDTAISGVVPDVARQRLLLLQSDGSVSTIDLSEYASYGFAGTMNPYPLVVDLDDDYIPEILITAGEWLFGFRFNGFLHEDFPVRMRESAVSQPVAGRVNGGGAWAVVVASTDGRLDAYDSGFRNSRVPGFPLPVGRLNSASPIVVNGEISGLSATGSLLVWDSGELLRGRWTEAFSLSNSSFANIAAAPNVSGSQDKESSEFRLLDAAKTYNWPNPIREGRTRIRVEPALTSDIQITIVNAAGSLVGELAYRGASGGVATEIEWITDAPSGIYIARITATSGALTETRLIKMAIIR